MKTDDLITLLSHNADPVPKLSVARLLLPVALVGGVVAASVTLAILGLIPREMFFEPGPWIKILYASALALSAAWLFSRSGKPGASSRQALHTLLGVVLVMGLAGLVAYLNTPESGRAAALMGHSWFSCPWTIMGLSLPMMAGSFWVMKRLAPTNLSLAGAACGLFSGAVAALAYALACTEAGAPFIALWYTLGIGICGATGTLLGPKLLNW